MKLLSMCLFILCIMSNIGLASPLTDYSQGSVAMDYTYRPSINVGGQIPDFEYFKGVGYSGFSGKLSTEGGITVGLGNNFALQYQQFNPTFNGPQTSFGPYYDSYGGSLQSQEINVLYKLDKNFAIFTGLLKIKPYMAECSYLPGCLVSSTTFYAGPEKKIGQLGLVASTEIVKKIKVYGIGAIGSDYSSWQVGVSYTVTHNWDFNSSLS